MKKRPQVLLLGNGVNQAYGGINWKTLLDKIAIRHDFDIEKMKSPYPLQAILLTNDKIKEAIDNQSDIFYGSIKSVQHSEVIKTILKSGFDDILTTNYSYELEAVALGVSEIDQRRTRKIARMQKFTGDHPEKQYLLHTYNEVKYENSSNRVWHIHGESRKKDSMILGHYWYGNQLCRVKDLVNDRKSLYKDYITSGKPLARESWVDSFILGDIYVLGFGYDVSEFDLWWLLNRKVRENAQTGTVYFYEPESEQNKEKTELLRLMKVEVINLGRKQSNDTNIEFDFQEFYVEAIADIQDRLRKQKTDLDL